jgi:hypothetical protein
MATTIETSAGKLEEQMKDFDVNRALNESGFPEFLALHSDAEVFDMANVDAIKARYETFKLKELLKGEYKGVVVEHIKGEMGITLDEADFADVELEFTKMAVNSPEKLKALADTIHQFKTLPIEIADLEAQIMEKGGSSAELAKRLADLNAEKESVELSKGAIGLFGLRETYVRVREMLAPNGTESEVRDYYLEYFNSKGIETDDLNSLDDITSFLAGNGREEMAAEAKDYVVKKAAENSIASARDRFDEKYGRNRATRGEVKKISDDLTKQIAGLEGAIISVDQIEDITAEIKAKYAKQRKELLGSMALYDSVRRGVAKKVNDEIRNKAKTARTMEETEALQARVKEIEDIKSQTETGIDPTATFADFAKDQAQMESALEARAKEIMIEAMAKVPIQTGALSGLRDSLKMFLERKKIGLKAGAEAKKKIAELLQSAADQLGATTEGVAKRILIRRLITELN